jgi:hypothetical protein
VASQLSDLIASNNFTGFVFSCQLDLCGRALILKPGAQVRFRYTAESGL